MLRSNSLLFRAHSLVTTKLHAHEDGYIRSSLGFLFSPVILKSITQLYEFRIHEASTVGKQRYPHLEQSDLHFINWRITFGKFSLSIRPVHTIQSEMLTFRCSLEHKYFNGAGISYIFCPRWSFSLLFWFTSNNFIQQRMVTELKWVKASHDKLFHPLGSIALLVSLIPDNYI